VNLIPSRWSRRLLVAGCALFVAFGFITALRQGANVDSGAVTDLARENLSVLGSGAPREVASTIDSLVASYGYSIQSVWYLLSRAYSWLTGSNFNPYSSLAFSLRNGIIFLISLASYSGTYLVASIISGSRRVGALGVAMLLAIGIFTGNSLMNDKDVPLASGYICLVALVVMRLLLKREELSSRNWQVAQFALGSFGLIFSLGTRPGLWPVFLALVAAGALAERSSTSGLRSLTFGYLVGFFVVVGTNGYLLRRPLWWFQNSLSVSSNFPWNGFVMVKGQLKPATPSWYGPLMIFEQLPMVCVVGVLATIVFTIRAVATISLIRNSTERRHVLAIVVVTGAASGPVLIGVLKESALYDAARQLLFVFPLLASLAAIGFFKMYKLSTRKILRCIVIGLASVGLASPVLATIQLFPYQQTYGNEVTAFFDAPSDYWFDNQGVSAREVQDWINTNLTQEREAALFPQNFQPFMRGKTLVDRGDPPGRGNPPWEIYAQIWRPAQLPDYYEVCPKVFEVSRSIYGQRRILAYARVCND
jgi:hypothetical protein